MTGDFLHEPSLELFMLCAGILTLKTLLTGAAIGTLRTIRGVYITPVGLQPWRTILFEVANVALVATTILLIAKVI